MNISLRPVEAEDTPFLRRLFHSWKATELGLATLPPAMLASLMDMQWHAHHDGLQAAYPLADKRMVLVDGETAGVLVLAAETGALHICEIALMPQWQGHGLGTHLLRHAQDLARAAGGELRLHVNRLNPAQNLYRRLGFVDCDDHGATLPMVWSGANR
ncbi:MAG: GNAT family N-acetyltransferase [Rhodospirillaceae bacterium]|nr:GNAT family N-acetyltransferase [Rhodospirillales bacterium]